MFTAYEPSTLFVEAHLLNRVTQDPKPHVVRLVLPVDPLAIPRVGLDAQALSFPLLRLADLLDSGRLLSLHIPPDEVFYLGITVFLGRPVGAGCAGPGPRLFGPDCKELEGGDARNR